MTKILQLENTSASEFKNEVVKEVKAIIEGFAKDLQATQPEQLLTREETSELLAVSLVTLWDWTRKGLVPAYRIGNKVRYKKKEVLAALKQMNKFES